jgi:hypothetical protein
MDDSHDDHRGPVSREDVAAAAQELDQLAARLADAGADVSYPTTTPTPEHLRLAAVMLERHVDGASPHRPALEAVAQWLHQLAREHELRAAMEERRRARETSEAALGTSEA